MAALDTQIDADKRVIATLKHLGYHKTRCQNGSKSGERLVRKHLKVT